LKRKTKKVRSFTFVFHVSKTGEGMIDESILL